MQFCETLSSLLVYQKNLLSCVRRLNSPRALHLSGCFILFHLIEFLFHYILFYSIWPWAQGGYLLFSEPGDTHVSSISWGQFLQCLWLAGYLRMMHGLEGAVRFIHPFSPFFVSDSDFHSFLFLLSPLSLPLHFSASLSFTHPFPPSSSGFPLLLTLRVLNSYNPMSPISTHTVSLHSHGLRTSKVSQNNS